MHGTTQTAQKEKTFDTQWRLCMKTCQEYKFKTET